jgi:hypothetical protein
MVLPPQTQNANPCLQGSGPFASSIGNDDRPDMHGLGGEHPEGVLRKTPVQTAFLIAVQLGSEERASDVSFGRPAHERDG